MNWDVAFWVGFVLWAIGMIVWFRQKEETSNSWMAVICLGAAVLWIGTIGGWSK